VILLRLRAGLLLRTWFISSLASGCRGEGVGSGTLLSLNKVCSFAKLSVKRMRVAYAGGRKNAVRRERESALLCCLVFGERCGREFFALDVACVDLRKLLPLLGRSSSAKIADTGHTGTQAPQSMHSMGSM